MRILERGDDAKGVLDAVVDQCGGLINLRTAIMRYRKPKRWFTFYRSASMLMPGSAFMFMQGAISGFGHVADATAPAKPQQWHI